jgi:hypothetical protein
VGQDYIGVPSVNEILGRYGYMCPKCKTRLSPPSQRDIVITSMRVARKKEMLPIKIGSHYYVKVDTKMLGVPGKGEGEHILSPT